MEPDRTVRARPACESHLSYPEASHLQVRFDLIVQAQPGELVHQASEAVAGHRCAGLALGAPAGVASGRCHELLQAYRQAGVARAFQAIASHRVKLQAATGSLPHLFFNEVLFLREPVLQAPASLFQDADHGEVRAITRCSGGRGFCV